MNKPADYLGHCVSLWVEDFFGDDHLSGEDIDKLTELLKAAIEYRDENGLPFEKPWVWDEVGDEEFEFDDDVFNLPEEVLEIVEVLCHEDMALAIQILNEYKTITNY